MKDIRESDAKKLQEQLIEKREKVRSLRFGLGSREVKNVREVRSIKRDIARIITVIREKQCAVSHDKSEITKQ